MWEDVRGGLLKTKKMRSTNGSCDVRLCPMFRLSDGKGGRTEGGAAEDGERCRWVLGCEHCDSSRHALVRQRSSDKLPMIASSYNSTH